MTEGTAGRAEGCDGGDDRMTKRRRGGYSQMTTIAPPSRAGPLARLKAQPRKVRRTTAASKLRRGNTRLFIVGPGSHIGCGSGALRIRGNEVI
jgi:hypothetical protein